MTAAHTHLVACDTPDCGYPIHAAAQDPAADTGAPGSARQPDSFDRWAADNGTRSTDDPNERQHLEVGPGVRHWWRCIPLESVDRIVARALAASQPSAAAAQGPGIDNGLTDRGRETWERVRNLPLFPGEGGAGVTSTEATVKALRRYRASVIHAVSRGRSILRDAARHDPDLLETSSSSDHATGVIVEYICRCCSGHGTHNNTFCPLDAAACADPDPAGAPE